MPANHIVKRTGLLILAGIMDLPLVIGQTPPQVVLAPGTTTQGVTLLVGSPASEITISVVRTGMVTVDNLPSINSSPTHPAPPVTPTVFVTDSAPAATTALALNQIFSLPALPAVVTQAPCVSACLQEPLIASAIGSCYTVIDNGCACLSAPVVAIHALTNCASAACAGPAAGPSGLSADLVAITSLYNDYCVSVVGSQALSSAVASGQAVIATAAASSVVTVTAGADTSSTPGGTIAASNTGGTGTVTGSTGSTGSIDPTTPWATPGSTNGTLTGNATIATNGTFGGGATLTIGPNAVDPGITGALASSLTTLSATMSPSGSTKSEAGLEVRHGSQRIVLSLLVGLTLPFIVL